MNSFGRTGAHVEGVSLGGEGVLRTHGRAREAVPMIAAALEAGVRYCDTAPAYDQSQDYYGQAFREASSARDRVFLASKTHERGKRGALRLLEDSLRRLGTDRLDVWQMHDLRDREELEVMFGPGGAIEAAEEAKRAGKIRFVGLTGHEDPEILLEAMRRYRFDTVLLPVNASDPMRAPFVTSVIPEARRQGVGVVGMKVMSAGQIPRDGIATAEECIRYAMAFADTLIIGCRTAAEIQSNLEVARTKAPMDEAEQRALEARFSQAAGPGKYDYFKA